MFFSLHAVSYINMFVWNLPPDMQLVWSARCGEQQLIYSGRRWITAKLPEGEFQFGLVKVFTTSSLNCDQITAALCSFGEEVQINFNIYKKCFSVNNTNSKKQKKKNSQKGHIYHIYT